MRNRYGLWLPVILSCLFLMWWFVLAYSQGTLGYRSAVGPFLAGAGFILVWFLGEAFERWHFSTYPLITAALAAGAIYVIGSYSYWLDFWIVIVMVLAEILLFRWLERRRPHDVGITQVSKVTGLVIATGFLVPVWIAASTVDWLQKITPLSLHPASRTQRVQSRFRSVSVGVALSGGGYRAALLHSGVLTALDKAGVPISHLTAVSGGAIVGGFYAAGGNTMDFAKAISDGRVRLRRDLSHFWRAIRLQLPLSIFGARLSVVPIYQTTRSDIFANSLGQTFFRPDEYLTVSNVTLNSIRRKGSGAPELMILTTELLTGRLVAFTANGVFCRHIPRPENTGLFANLTAQGSYDDVHFVTDRNGGLAVGDLPLEQLLAASAAFPPVLDPVRLDLSLESEGNGPPYLLLSDGGIADNSGLELLMAARRSAPNAELRQWAVDVVVASDGGSLFREVERVSPVLEISRAADIVYGYSSTAAATRDAAFGGDRAKRKSDEVFLLSPSGILGSVTKESEQRARNVLEQAIRKPSNLQKIIISDIQQLIANDEASHELTVDARDASSPGTNQASPLPDATRLASDFVACLQGFVNTPTLKEDFTRREVSALVRLGEYLVLLNINSIHAEMERALQRTPPSVITPGHGTAGASDVDARPRSQDRPKTSRPDGGRRRLPSRTRSRRTTRSSPERSLEPQIVTQGFAGSSISARQER